MDKKYEIQKIAEGIAYREHGLSFYDLSEETQDIVFGKAEVEFEERMMEKADQLRKRMVESP